MRLSFRILPALVFLLGTSVRAEELTPAEVFFRYPKVMEAQLSPSGTRLAIKTSDKAGRVVLLTLDLTEDKWLHTAGSRGTDVADFHWVGDDRLIFSFRDLRLKGQDEQKSAPGLFSFMPKEGSYHTLIATRGVFHFVVGRDNPLGWNHDLLTLLKPQPGVDPDVVVVGRSEYDWHDDLDRVVPVRLNVRTGEAHTMDLGPVPAHAQEWWFDSAGHPRAIYTEHEGRGAYYWRGPGDESWRQIAQAPVNHLPFGIVSVDDAGQLYVTESRGNDEIHVLTHFDFSRNAPAEHPLVQVPGFDFEGALLNETAGAETLGVRVYADAETTAWFLPAMRDFQTLVDRRFPGHVNRIQCRRCGSPDMVALVLSYADRDPGTLWLYRAAQQRWFKVTAVRDGVEPGRMARVDFQRIKARDGSDLPVWLTLPPGVKPGQPAPTVVMVHGGPWARDGYWQWNAMNQFLASRGYLVIEPEFRGSEGYGKAHLRAGNKQWGQAMEDDLADALHWAQDQGLSVKGRACIMGASYGGYAALMGPVRQPDDWSCVVAWSAVADLRLMLEGSWWIRDDIDTAGRKYGYTELVADLNEDAAMIDANSPVRLARQMHAPVLLAYGDADLRTPISHGKRMRDALTDAGNPPVWIVYKGEGHGFANPDNEIDFARQIESFLAKHLH